MVSRVIVFLTRSLTNLKSGPRDYFWTGWLVGGLAMRLSPTGWGILVFVIGIGLYVEERRRRRKE